MSLPKLIIIEGADGTGKTTLGRYLAQRSGAVLLHQTSMGDAPNRPIQKYFDNVLENVEWLIRHQCKHIILDRHWPSEVAYGRALGRDMAEFDYQPFVDRIQDLGGLYIFCCSSTAIDRHHLKKDPDHPYDDEVFKKVVANYHQLFMELISPDNEIIHTNYDFEMQGSDLDKYYTHLCT